VDVEDTEDRLAFIAMLQEVLKVYGTHALPKNMLHVAAGCGKPAGLSKIGCQRRNGLLGFPHSIAGGRPKQSTASFLADHKML
jgi:hypothetical protein